MKKIYWLIVFLPGYVVAQPLNNMIFKGSNSDGFGNAGYVMAALNIFAGGSGDGSYGTVNNSVSNNIFKGGNGDGINAAINLAPANPIFAGGFSDGWNFSANSIIPNTIFFGGVSDGWNFSANASVPNVIFKGGDGDGWASTYRPQGPLPVTIVSFNAVKRNREALISWTTSSEINTKLFEVQRSSDALNFVTIGTVNATGFSTTTSQYRFTDHGPLHGLNYYRLKVVDTDNSFRLTPARVLSFGNVSETVRFYPNPAFTSLFVELDLYELSKLKAITIINAAGIVVDQLFAWKISGNKLKLDVSKYPAGIYFIQLYGTNTKVINVVVK